MANNAQQMHIVPRYNALHNNSTNAILRFSSEAANIRKSGYLFPKISYSPISPAQAEDTNSSEFSNSDTFLMPTLCENTSPHMGIENPSPPPTVDVTSMIHTSVRTRDSISQEMSYFQDMRKKLSHTLNFQCALLQKQVPIPLTSLEQQMLQSMLNQDILPLSFASLFSNISSEVAQSISAFNLGANHFLK